MNTRIVGALLIGSLATAATAADSPGGPTDGTLTLTAEQLLANDRPGPANEAGQTLTLSINGLLRTFTLDGRGNAVTPEARIHLRVYKFTVDGALFDTAGGLIANAPHLPVHLGAMGESVRVIATENAGKMRPGDAFVANGRYEPLAIPNRRA